jgi:hypothetical protein
MTSSTVLALRPQMHFEALWFPRLPKDLKLVNREGGSHRLQRR